MNAHVRQKLSAIDAIPGVTSHFDAPLAPLTTYKVGGPASVLVQIANRAGVGAVLALLADAGVPWFVLGNGSNVLISDVGFGGAVLRLGGELAVNRLDRNKLAPGQHRLEAGAGLSITRLLRVTKEERLAGLECLGGVPGTVGGAVVMNAGTVLGELKDSLEAAEIVTPAAAARWLPASQLGLSYRSSQLPEGAVVTGARFVCTDADEAMRRRLDEVLAYRKATQPLTMPSCGSVFANPPGDHAGRLIEACGLKGHVIGRAQVSEQHANWIVNLGDAKASDVRSLIEHVRAEVSRQHGVTLRSEVRVLGDWDAQGWDADDWEVQA